MNRRGVISPAFFDDDKSLLYRVSIERSCWMAENGVIFADSRESGVFRRWESNEELDSGPECSDGGRKEGLSSSE